jgi:hypothetical protein
MTKKLTDIAFELAHQAEFIFWDPDEGFGEVIDWASNYDNEVVDLVRLTVRRCWEISKDDRILEHFGLMKRVVL